MLKNYLKIAWRNLVKNKTYSFINISGFAVGLAVAVLIGLWIWDEFSFNKYHDNYSRIGEAWIRGTNANNETGAFNSMPAPTGEALRQEYGDNFEHIVMTSFGRHNISAGENKFFQYGSFMGNEAPDMLSLKMLKGNRNGLREPHSILLSNKLATSLFGDQDPINKVVKIDNRIDVKVTGVYENLPLNTSFSDMGYIAPWNLFVTEWKWVNDIKDNWGFHSFQLFVQLKPNTTFEQAETRVKNLITDHDKSMGEYKAALFFHPMSRWHLYNEFKNGYSTGGQIQFVWLFGIIGFFVLLLACINFMNLSTARSEKRAKEVGIRKAIGSMRTQLLGQFYTESILVALFAFILSLVIVQAMLPWFNTIANKQLTILWTNPWFWAICIIFSLFTGFLSGSYPAAYLSSFQPIKVLKGTFRAGRFAATPRKVLVVVQFTVSVLLITGTITVFRQIQHAKNRPVGYSTDGLISIQMTTPQIYQHYKTIQKELLNDGVAIAVSQSQGPLTDIWVNGGNIEWKGKLPSHVDGFAIVGASHGHGKAAGWHIKDGRDFSQQFATDSSGIILNETAVKYMGLENPVGQTVRWDNKDYHILGVIQDMVMTSPYAPTAPSLFYILPEAGNFVNIKMNPALSAAAALKKIEKVMQEYNPAAPFEYSFVSEDYAKKFSYEERVSKLASFITLLAIFISCLGLFGLASFMAEQRTKEIGIRKVLGASVFNLWRMLSKEFVMLVAIAILIATPTAYYFLQQWLERYPYRIAVSWWIFAASGMGALLITLLTVSSQTIKAAVSNPVRSLRSE